MTGDHALTDALSQYVKSGKLLHLATQGEDGPAACCVWYAVSDNLRTLVYTSNVAREHSENVRARHRVAGSVVTIDLDGLGQVVTGAFLRGVAVEAMSEDDIRSAYALYSARWPQVKFTETELMSATTPMRMYVISVDEYVWFDERIDGAPRHVIEAATIASD